MKRHTLALALSSLVAFGCAEESLVSFHNMFYETDKLDRRQAEFDTVKARYDVSLEEFRQQIATRKQGVDTAIDSGDLAAALDQVGALYSLTHPCGEDECGTYPCEICSNRQLHDLPPINKYEVFIEREGIDDERAFISASMGKIFKLTGSYLSDERFGEADAILAKYIDSIPLPSENASRYTSRHAELKDAWLTVLEADADAASARYPGAALVLYAKAAQLSAQRGMDDDAARHTAKAQTMRAEVIEELGYTIALGSITGPSSNELSTDFLEASYDGAVRPKRSGRARATLDLSLGTPKYKRSRSSTTASFRYISGTSLQTNPDWAFKKRTCETNTGIHDKSVESCNRWGGDNINCGSIERDRERMNDSCGELAGIAQQIQVDVYDDFSYPVTLHNLDTTLPVRAKITHADRRKPLSHATSESRLTDREHSAHEKGGQRVSADQADPPSEASGYSAARDDAKSDLRALVMSSFEGYRARLAQAEQGGDLAESHNLTSVIVLRPGKMPSGLVSRLSAASGVADAAALVTGLP